MTLFDDYDPPFFGVVFMFSFRSFSSPSIGIGVFLASVAFIGCSNSVSTVSNSLQSAVTGNWQIASASMTATKLPSISGELTGSASGVTGIFHANAAAKCVASTTPIEVSGEANAKNVLILTGAVAGGALSIQGTLAEDGKSLTNASYNVSGGSCAFSEQASATAQSFSSVSGTYTGTFSDPTGQVIGLTATLTQTPASDTDGNFQLSGTANLGSNPCFSSPVTISNSQVTGGTFTLTYADPATSNSVTATGTFSTDASTLTVTNWALSGPCGPDTGTGLLTRQ